ncbi:MAG: hypothetical protein K2K38_02295 [Clostridia bacterium]|nr:hypothetical protein [Clostridia bacterium]
MSNYKTYRKEKWLYFAFAIIAYFLPFIIVTACLLPMVKAAEGFKIAMGLGIVVINAIPFLMGVFKAFFAHFPMFNLLAVIFLLLAAFFALDAFKSYMETLCWIELAAAVGSVISCILWGQYKKYADFNRTMKATVKSGAFKMKEDKE